MSAIPKYGFKADDVVKKGRTTRSNIEDIKKWLTYKPNIPQMSEEQIVMFLLACKNVVENTQTTIEHYFKQKFTSPELFSNRDIDTEENQYTHSVTNFAVFPHRIKDNYVVAIGSLKDTAYYKFHIEAQIKATFALIDAFLYEEPPNGLIFIMNMKGVGLMHITRLKIGPLRKFFAYLQEALPTILVEIHILNSTYVFEKILQLVKPFMKKELFDLIICHSPDMDMDQFFEQHIPASNIPADFGGDLPSLEQLNQDLQNYCRKRKSFLEAGEKQVQLYKTEK